MKLAEALNVRGDLQKRIQQLRERLMLNAKVQEGDRPSEEPEALITELNQCCVDLEGLIKAINKTNSFITSDGVSIADLLAKKDVLTLKINILRDFLRDSSERIERYSNKEIKILSTVNVSEMQKEIDGLSKELRELNTRIQALNWTTDLI